MHRLPAASRVPLFSASGERTNWRSRSDRVHLATAKDRPLRFVEPRILKKFPSGGAKAGHGTAELLRDLPSPDLMAMLLPAFSTRVSLSDQLWDDVIRLPEGLALAAFVATAAGVGAALARDGDTSTLFREGGRAFLCTSTLALGIWAARQAERIKNMR